MDEEYQNTVNQTSSSNPWADFEPIDTPPVNNINNQRTISRPEAPSSGRTVYNHSRGLVALLDR